jgi:hypothetical protein
LRWLATGLGDLKDTPERLAEAASRSSPPRLPFREVYERQYVDLYERRNVEIEIVLASRKPSADSVKVLKQELRKEFDTWLEAVPDHDLESFAREVRKCFADFRGRSLIRWNQNYWKPKKSK